MRRFFGSAPKVRPLALSDASPPADPGRRLSGHFLLAEFTRSQTAARLCIDNTPPAAAVQALRRLCLNVLEPVRAHFGPVRITSGYRCPKLNAAVGSSPRSQHVKGEAADFEVPGVSNYEVARWIAAGALSFDQLILENHTPGQPNSGWVHVSWSISRARGDVLTWAPRAGYRKGLMR